MDYGIVRQSRFLFCNVFVFLTKLVRVETKYKSNIKNTFLASDKKTDTSTALIVFKLNKPLNQNCHVTKFYFEIMWIVKRF